MPVDVDIARPSGEITPRFRRWLATLVGVAAFSAACLAWMESDSGRQEEQAFVDASRSAIDVFVSFAAGGSRSTFELDALRRALKVELEAAARVGSAPTADDEEFARILALAQAQTRAAKRLRERIEALSRLPARAAGVDEATLDALNTVRPKEVIPTVEAANAAVDRAGTYGTRQERAMFALGLVAIAASLLGLAGLMGASRGGWISLGTAVVALVVALGWGVSGYL